MKKAASILLALAMVAGLAACGDSGSSAAPAADAAAEQTADAGGADDAAEESTGGDGEVSVGVVWYNFGDTFIANARTTVNDLFAGNPNFKVVDADSQNDISVQTNNLNNLYTQGVDYMVLNNINTNMKTEIIEQAKEKGVTIIFANTDSPDEDEFALYDNVYHVSSRAEQSGTIIGEQIAEYWQNNPDADRNGDGKLNYVMLLGVQQHYDTQVRAQYSIEAIEAAGIETELVQEAICDYQRAIAQDEVASMLQARKDDIEAIIACNDDMALGAIEALKASGFFGEGGEFIPVVGVDATAVGVEALEDGTLLGTALNNPVTLGNSVYELICLLERGDELTAENLGVDGVDVEGHHVYINYMSITAENTDDANY